MKRIEDPNTKQLREELQILTRTRRKIARDFDAELRRVARVVKTSRASLKTAQRNTESALGRIDRRLAILNGRLGA